jgi:hypothetical protein
MQVHNLKETMVKKGVAFERECLIFEVCQPQQAKKVLDQNMSVSTALPCRISIYEEGGKAILATLKPTTLLAMFNTPQLAGCGKSQSEASRPKHFIVELVYAWRRHSTERDVQLPLP